MRPQYLGLVAMATFSAGASASSTSGHKIYSARHRNEFMKAIESSHNNGSPATTHASGGRTRGYHTKDPSDVQKLRRRVLEKAKYIPPDEIPPLRRNLEDMYNGQNADDYYYGYNPDDQNGADDDDDGYYAADNDDDNTGSSSSRNSYSSSLFPFDLTQYSIAYHRCANVRQFDDQLAAQTYTSSVFETKHFAMFRLCPSNSCDPDIDENAADTNYWAARAYQSSQTSSGSGSSSNSTASSSQQQRAKYLYEKIGSAGANGNGCNSDYGEYMLELEDYLGIMTDYHNERFEKYCSACQECMYDTYSNWLHSNGFDRRDLKDINDPSWMDELDSEEFQQHYNRHLGYSPYTTCPEYGTCKTYSNVCATGIDNSLTQYFTCSPIEVYNGKTLYIGPRCSYDSISIKLGVYADENCNDYVGRSVDITDLLGEEIDHASLFVPYITGNVHIEIENHGGYSSDISEYYRPIDQICIPCKASRQPYEVLGSDYDFNDDNSNDVNDLCEDLYIASAQCDKSISYRNYKQYTSRKQRSQQELSCDFIQSIMAGKFDQNGFVESSFGIPEIIETWSDISTSEAYGLVVVIAICFILSMWVYVLHHYINEREPWRMRRRRCLVSRHRSVSKVLHDDDTSVGSFESEIIYGAPSKITKRIRSAASVVSRSASRVLPRAPPIVSRAASSIASKAMYPFKRTQTWAAGSDHSSAKTESTPNSVEILKMEIDKLRMHLHNTSTSFDANNGFEIKNVTTHQDQISVAEISEIKGSWSEALPVHPRPVEGRVKGGGPVAKEMTNTKNNVMAQPQTCLADEITESGDSKLEGPEPALRYALPTQQSASVEEDADWDNRLGRQISLDDNSSASYSSYATESTGTNISRYEWDSAANTLRRIGSSVTGLSSIDENGLVTDVDELQRQLKDLKRHLASPGSPKASAMRRTQYSSERSKNKKSKNKVSGRIKKIFGRK